MRAWGLWLLLFGACGGRASHSEVTESQAGSASDAGGSASDAGGSASDAGGSAGALVGCPDESWGECPGRFTLDLHFDGTRTKANDGAVWAEPLQLPAPPLSPVHGPSVPVEPADWDRSPLPAAACVLRLHGVPADCVVSQAGRLRGGACGVDGPPVVLTSHYEDQFCAEGTAPGCAGDDRALNVNHRWYAVAESDESTLLVICGGLCSTFVATEGSAMCVVGGPAL